MNAQTAGPSPELVEAVDALTRARFPERLGFLLLDLSDASAAVVHARRFLRQNGHAGGLRCESLLPVRRDELLRALQPHDSYVIVALDDDLRATDSAAVELIELVNARALPWFTVSRRGDQLCAIDVGAAETDPGSERRARSEPVQVRIEAVRSVTDLRFLPFELEVNAAQVQGTFKLELRGATIGQEEFDILLRSRDGQPIGRGKMKVDVLLRPGRSDEVVFEPRFERPVDLEFGASTLSLNPLPAELHVLFDCTTLDAESWPSAVAAAYLHGFPADGQWNLKLREAVATTLADAVGRVTRPIDLDLWWFGDRAREDIAPAEGASESLPYFRLGRTRAGELVARMTSRTFEYRRGLDLFDSVDEALLALAGAIADAPVNERQHAVLIIGDSPPPPEGQHDPLWIHFVAGPPATNARRSPHFRAAVTQLERAGVPVTWIFIKSLVERSHDKLYERYHDAYMRLMAIRERVVNALQQFEGVSVRPCDGIAQVRAAVEETIAAVADLDMRSSRASVDLAGGAL